MKYIFKRNVFFFLVIQYSVSIDFNLCVKSIEYSSIDLIIIQRLGLQCISTILNFTYLSNFLLIKDFLQKEKRLIQSGSSLFKTSFENIVYLYSIPTTGIIVRKIRKVEVLFSKALAALIVVINLVVYWIICVVQATCRVILLKAASGDQGRDNQQKKE